MKQKICHMQHESGQSTSECYMCVHRRVCKMLASVEKLDLPHPFTIEFECEFYK